MYRSDRTQPLVRTNLRELLLPTDEALKDIVEHCSIADILHYAGTISSIMFIPFLSRFFDSIKIDFYDSNIYLYAMDTVIEKSHTVYIVVPFSQSKQKTSNGKSLFLQLLDFCGNYYYDNRNIVYAYTLPDKHKVDYDVITSSRYSEVTPEYKKLCQKDGVAYAVVTNNNTLKVQWQKLEKILSVPPSTIVSESRFFPEFVIEKETYYAKEKTAQDKETDNTLLLVK